MGTKLCVRKASERGLLWEERIGLLKYGCPSVFLITTYCAAIALPNAGQIFTYDRDWHGLALAPQAMGGKDLFVRPAGKVVGVGVSGKRRSGSVDLTSATRCRRPQKFEKRSATWNCLFPGAERLPGVGRTWSVRHPTRESPSARPPRCRPKETMTSRRSIPWVTPMEDYLGRQL